MCHWIRSPWYTKWVWSVLSRMCSKRHTTLPFKSQYKGFWIKKIYVKLPLFSTRCPSHLRKTKFCLHLLIVMEKCNFRQRRSKTSGYIWVLFCKHGLTQFMAWMINYFRVFMRGVITPSTPIFNDSSTKPPLNFVHWYMSNPTIVCACNYSFRT